jgi:serine/threonine-protein kinase
MLSKSRLEHLGVHSRGTTPVAPEAVTEPAVAVGRLGDRLDPRSDGRRSPLFARKKLLAGRFRLDHRLGHGGMSEVWLARDRRLDRQVAVKLHTAETEPDLLLCEAQSVASLSHPNVAAVYDYGESDGVPFVVLEYLCGGTLQQRLAVCKPLPDSYAARVARDLAAALAHAHEHGVVHCDLKPSNVVFDAESRGKLVDFGIASPRGRDPLRRRGAIVGTPAYIAPELAAGRPPEPASDVYSFGILLFQMLTGALPFDADSPAQLARMHIAIDARPVQSVRADAPKALSVLADSALARDVGARPADGSALLGALSRKSPHCSQPREQTSDAR